MDREALEKGMYENSIVMLATIASSRRGRASRHLPPPKSEGGVRSVRHGLGARWCRSYQEKQALRGGLRARSGAHTGCSHDCSYESRSGADVARTRGADVARTFGCADPLPAPTPAAPPFPAASPPPPSGLSSRPVLGAAFKLAAPPSRWSCPCRPPTISPTPVPTASLAPAFGRSWEALRDAGRTIGTSKSVSCAPFACAASSDCLGRR